MPKLHPIIAIIIAFVIFQFIFVRQIMPLLNMLKTTLSTIKYMDLLLSSLVILICAEFIAKLLDEHEYESISHLVHLSAHVAIVGIWWKEVSPMIQPLQKLVDSFKLFG